MMLRRSSKNACRSVSISGSVRQGWPCTFQYAFHASVSSLVGCCTAGACLPFCSSLVVLVLRLLRRFVEGCAPSWSLISFQLSQELLNLYRRIIIHNQDERRKRCIIQQLPLLSYDTLLHSFINGPISDTCFVLSSKLSQSIYILVR